MIKSNEKYISKIYRGDQSISNVLVNDKDMWNARKYKYEVMFIPYKIYLNNNYFCGNFGFLNFCLLIGGTENHNNVGLDLKTYGIDVEKEKDEETPGKMHHNLASYRVNGTDSLPISRLPQAMYNNGLVLTVKPILFADKTITKYDITKDKTSNAFLENWRSNHSEGGMWSCFCKYPDGMYQGKYLYGYYYKGAILYDKDSAAKIIGLKFTWSTDDEDLINNIKGFTFYQTYYSYSDKLYNHFTRSPVIVYINPKEDTKWSTYLHTGQLYYELAAEKDQTNVAGEVNTANLYDKKELLTPTNPGTNVWPYGSGAGDCYWKVLNDPAVPATLTKGYFK